MIRVVNKAGGHYPNGVYVGRGSPLGNPYPMENQSDAERARVIELYKAWLIGMLKLGDARITHELNYIRDTARTDDVDLVCFCAPKACHADYIKELVEAALTGAFLKS